jgi:hypothetical protein
MLTSESDCHGAPGTIKDPSLTRNERYGSTQGAARFSQHPDNAGRDAPGPPPGFYIPMGKGKIPSLVALVVVREPSS